MPFTGSWLLDYASRYNVAGWIKSLNISNNTVIDNHGFCMQIQCVNNDYYLAGGLIYIEHNKLYRVGQSVNSLQVFIRKENIY